MLFSTPDIKSMVSVHSSSINFQPTWLSSTMNWQLNRLWVKSCSKPTMLTSWPMLEFQLINGLKGHLAYANQSTLFKNLIFLKNILKQSQQQSTLNKLSMKLHLPWISTTLLQEVDKNLLLTLSAQRFCSLIFCTLPTSTLEKHIKFSSFWQSQIFPLLLSVSPKFNLPIKLALKAIFWSAKLLQLEMQPKLSQKILVTFSPVINHPLKSTSTCQEQSIQPKTTLHSSTEPFLRLWLSNNLIRPMNPKPTAVSKNVQLTQESPSAPQFQSAFPAKLVWFTTQSPRAANAKPVTTLSPKVSPNKPNATHVSPLSAKAVTKAPKPYATPACQVLTSTTTPSVSASMVSTKTKPSARPAPHAVPPALLKLSALTAQTTPPETQPMTANVYQDTIMLE